ncbi:hypothetical protein ACN4EK_11560 [Pantanalinema rosaneae CENA516]|uniref:hypothetical protein n=1 Tax=Pantanalinema rosaneae TaxID=1620701 RepID=UPI003D6F1EE9
MMIVLWLGLAWIAGTATILGSLMTIASLLLWLLPPQPQKSNGTGKQSPRSAWYLRWRLTAVAVVMALTGFLILLLVSFPLGNNVSISSSPL